MLLSQSGVLQFVEISISLQIHCHFIYFYTGISPMSIFLGTVIISSQQVQPCSAIYLSGRAGVDLVTPF